MVWESIPRIGNNLEMLHIGRHLGLLHFQTIATTRDRLIDLNNIKFYISLAILSNM